MNRKPVVIIVGLVLLALLLMIDFAQVDQVSRLDLTIQRLNEANNMASSEKANLINRRNELKRVIEVIPPALLTGFEDPEAGFVEFLDYLASPVMKEVGSSVDIQNQLYTTSPVPLHQSEISFKYTFDSTYEAEKFLNFILFQERFPLLVKSFSAKRQEGKEVGAEVSVALLIPARLKLDITSADKNTVSK